MYLRPLLTITSMALLLTTACDPKTETRTGKVSLTGTAQPFLTTSESYPANRTAWPCPLEVGGTAPDAPAAGFHSVGYEHRFDAGTKPFPCQSRINHVHRLVTAFDLSPIPHATTGVHAVSATLSFDKRRGAGNHDCEDHVLAVADIGPETGSPINPASNDKWENPVPLLTNTAACKSGRCTMDVAGQVNDWIHGIMKEQGFVLRGEDERLNANDNVSCRNEYSNFRLDVTFKHEVKKGSTPIATPIIKPIEISSIKLDVFLSGSTPTSSIYRLEWSGAKATVDIYRNAALYKKITSSVLLIDTAPRGTVTYKVCNAGTTTCSPPVTRTN
jgi:hypothetical protein